MECFVAVFVRLADLTTNWLISRLVVVVGVRMLQVERMLVERNVVREQLGGMELVERMVLVQRLENTRSTSFAGISVKQTKRKRKQLLNSELFRMCEFGIFLK